MMASGSSILFLFLIGLTLIVIVPLLMVLGAFWVIAVKLIGGFFRMIFGFGASPPEPPGAPRPARRDEGRFVPPPKRRLGFFRVLKPVAGIALLLIIAAGIMTSSRNHQVAQVTEMETSIAQSMRQGARDLSRGLRDGADDIRDATSELRDVFRDVRADAGATVGDHREMIAQLFAKGAPNVVEPSPAQNRYLGGAVVVTDKREEPLLAALGMGTAPAWATSRQQREELARRAALTDARRNLLTNIAAAQPIEAPSLVALAEGAYGSDVSTTLNGWLRGATVLDESVDESGTTATITLGITPAELTRLFDEIAAAQIEGRLPGSAAYATARSAAGSSASVLADTQVLPFLQPAGWSAHSAIIGWTQFTLHLIAAMLLIGLWATWSQNTP